MIYKDDFETNLEVHLGLHNQSDLAIILGVLICLGSFAFLLSGPFGVIGWLISLAFGVVLVRLGMTKVPDYEHLAKFISYSIDDKIKKIKSK